MNFTDNHYSNYHWLILFLKIMAEPPPISVKSDFFNRAIFQKIDNLKSLNLINLAAKMGYIIKFYYSDTS